jgi:hypothetical protein
MPLVVDAGGVQRPLLKRALAGAPSPIRDDFDVTPASSLKEFVREAPRHPVFPSPQPPLQRLAVPRTRPALHSAVH